MDLSESPAEIQIFGNLCQISNRLETIGNDFLEDLTTKQWFFLAFLSNFYNDPPTLSEMAAMMGSSHQNVKQIALNLQKKGFVEIIKNKEDGRSLRLCFTEKAMEYGKNFDKKGSNFMSLLYGGFTSEEMENLKNYTNRLLDTLKNMQESKNYKNYEDGVDLSAK